MAKGVRSVTWQIFGADELTKSLEALPIAMQKQVLGRAVTKAGRVFVPPLRKATPVSKWKSSGNTPSGTTRASTGIVTRRKKGVSTAVVGHKRLAGMPGRGGGTAAHLVDLGTAQRKTRKGQNRGAVAARHYRAPVYAANRAQAHAVLQKELAAGLAIAVKKNDMKIFNKAIQQ